MAFDWAGAAGGVQDYLERALKQQLAEREMQTREQSLKDNAEWRKLQAEQNRLSYESLADARRAQADERNQRVQARQQRLTWAQNTVAAGPPPPITADSTPEERFAFYNYATARHFLNTGEELPDTVTANILTPRPQKEDPNLLSPDALKQRRDLIAYTERERGRYRRTGSGAAAASRAETAQAHKDIQDYQRYLKGKYGNNAAGALNEWDTQPDAPRKGRGKVNLASYRNLLMQMFGGTPKQQWENNMYTSMGNPGTTPNPNEEDDDEGIY